MKFTFITILIVLARCSSVSTEPVYMEYTTPLIEVLTAEQFHKSDVQVRVYKAQYKLEVWAKDDLLRTYKIVLGGNPEGQKLMEGDQKTPEGIFKVRNLYPHAKWSKFIWFDYPKAQSVLNHQAALANGTIPENATIGGEVGIHGVPEGKDSWIEQSANWTLGCVSLTTKDINDLYEVLQKGTEIHIYP